MNTSKVFMTAIAGIVAIGGLTFYVMQQSPSLSATSGASAGSLAKSSAKITVGEDKKVVSYEGQTGKTALQLLRSTAQVGTEQSTSGEFVTVINGVEADGMEHLWSLYSNGEFVNADAQTYQTTTGEHIEWRVEAVQ